jgi:hypothetical protein
MYEKSNHVPFFGKGITGKIIGGVKGLARLADEPLVQSAVGLVAPEVAAGLAVAKRTGLLEKLKH